MPTVEAAAAVVPGRPVGAWTIAWRRLRRDKIALASAGILSLIVFAAFAGGPIAAKLLGHGPDDLFPYAQHSLKPVGPWTQVPDTSIIESLVPDAPPPKNVGTTLFVLGADGPLGRDELLRVLYGGRVSLEVAFGAAFLAILIGVTLGLVAAYFGGFVDSVISRFIDLVMAFPLLLFLVMVGYTVAGDKFARITVHGVFPQGVVSLVLIIGLFTWFYPARIVRSQVISLRHQAFVEAATSTGASDSWIIRKHLVPHVLPTLLVWGSIAAATNIMLEAGVTFLGAGIRIPTASWGTLLSSTWGTVANPTGYDPTTFSAWPTLLPTVAIFVTVLAFNQLGESMRSVLDPKAVR
ncbi:MAG: ABC transporter permease [Actinobacteria bacterium]|nr:MAG: ABC transporter permease [Actinomycetota bacterium]